jgi:tRNA-specific 2-thiouridylase
MTKDKSDTLVIVGMSGGVDSSVAAAMLVEQGYRVVGMFMKNWDEKDENGVCQASKEYEDVVKVCEHLGIDYYSIEFVKEYWDNVFTEFLEGYKKGYTPNPDILCNREIKFKVFLDKAMELGADYLATGHYCQKVPSDHGNQLVKGVDSGKDQTYFLYTMKKEILDKVMFPLGHLPKSEVRALAKKYGLSTQDKKDSTGICFIGERNFKNFLSSYISFTPGEFQTLDGTVVGKHSGTSFYTIGQRKGLGLGGPGEPWFVVSKSVNDNIVYVERGAEHPALYIDELYANELSWVDQEEKPRVGEKLSAKVRYRQEDQLCTVVSDEDGLLKISFDRPQRGVALMQSIVFYRDDVCLGGGVINRVGPNYFEQGKVITSI